MRMRGRRLAGAAGVVALAVAAIAVTDQKAATAEGYKVVVNTANTTASLKRGDVADMFLGKTSKWPDGGKVVPVDQSAVSPVRAAFTKQVLGKNVDGVVNYWQQAVFSGRGVPPKAKGSDQEVVDFVSANAGAVGYVSAETPADKVKVLKVDP